MKILNIITRDQLKALRDAGFAVVHRDPPPSMWKAGASARDMPGGWHIDQGGCWHRMIAESIRTQNAEQDDPKTE